ncbi:MAG: lamin tail domain-containing protein [Candidatus Zixiibacteriota bacterium]
MKVATLVILTLSFVAAGWAGDPSERIFLSEVHYSPDGDSPPPFIELYNGSKTNVKLGGWSVKISAKTGESTARLPNDAVIPSCGFYLIGNSDDRAQWEKRTFKPDYYCKLPLDFSTAGGGVKLLLPSGAVRDVVGWGRGAPFGFYEGTPHQTVDDGHSLERKSSPTHSEVNGNSYDRDDNSGDLRERSTPQPQNINSPREYPPAVTGNESWSRIKAMYAG